MEVYHHMSLNEFDAIYYINLDHRLDRKEAILAELYKEKVHPEKINRIPAIYHELNGHMGCVQSHMLALQKAMEKKHRRTLILEDDCYFIRSPSRMIKKFFQKVGESWDVFFLGTNVRAFDTTPYSKVQRVTDSLCAHAYAVNHHYLEKLYSCFHVTLDLMKGDLFATQSLPKALDRVWHVLQKEDRWYIMDNLAQQAESYSDICKKVRNRLHGVSILKEQQ